MMTDSQLNNSYIVLSRGINVGGKNMISMASLATCLSDAGFSNVRTYIASGNVIVSSANHPDQIKKEIEALLCSNFRLDSELIKVLVLSQSQLEQVVKNKPDGFGEQPEIYHSDAIFLIDITTDEALTIFNPKENIDLIWPGEGVIYSQRLSAQRSKSRLNTIVGTKAYKSMTIRNWNTVTKLLALCSH